MSPNFFYTKNKVTALLSLYNFRSRVLSLAPLFPPILPIVNCEDLGRVWLSIKDDRGSMCLDAQRCMVSHNISLIYPFVCECKIRCFGSFVLQDLQAVRQKQVEARTSREQHSWTGSKVVLFLPSYLLLQANNRMCQRAHTHTRTAQIRSGCTYVAKRRKGKKQVKCSRPRFVIQKSDEQSRRASPAPGG